MGTSGAKRATADVDTVVLEFVEIKQEHIEKAARTSHPVYHAMRDRFPDMVVNFGHNFVTISNHVGTFWFNVDPAMKRYIDQFQTAQPVQPCTLCLGERHSDA